MSADKLNGLIALDHKLPNYPGWDQYAGTFYSPPFIQTSIYSWGLDNLIAELTGQAYRNYGVLNYSAFTPLTPRPNYEFVDANLASYLNKFADTVRFGVGVERSNLNLAWSNEDIENETKDILRISWGQAGGVKIVVPEVGGLAGVGVEMFEFSDGTQMSMQEMLALAPPRPAEPVVTLARGNSIADIQASEDTAFSFSLPSDAFVIQGNKTTRYTASLVGDSGSSLPGWLTFDPSTGALSGTPSADHIGNLQIEVIAWQSQSRYATQTFNLVVVNTNDAPTIEDSFEDLVADLDEPFSWSIPSGMFQDADAGDRLSYRVSGAGGAELPSWLKLNPATGELVGTPSTNDIGLFQIEVAVVDLAGEMAKQQFSIIVNPPAPTYVDGTSGDDQLMGTAFVNVFNGKEGNDILTGGAGNDTYVFEGNFGQDRIVDIDAKEWNVDSIRFGTGITPQDVTAHRSGLDLILENGANSITVVNWFTSSESKIERVVFEDTTVWNIPYLLELTNTAPTVALPLGDQVVITDRVWDFVLPSTAFADADFDSGDRLTLSAALLNGTALPAWLSFDPATGSFHGAPSIGDIGNVTIAVTATDAFGHTVSSSYALQVKSANIAPAVDLGIANVSTEEDAPLAFVLPANVFKDSDAGDVLTYSASLTDGNPLPSWLSFDAQTKTFSGMSGHGNIGSLTLQVTATDQGGLSASATFSVNVLTAADRNLFGTSDADTLTGSSGSDVLNGGTGADTLVGKLGDDLYVVDSAGDVVLEEANQGIDTVQAEVDYVLGANLENLTLTGTSPISGTGNSLDNVLIGNAANNALTSGAGNDVLDGGAGTDTLTGGLGDDAYVVDATADTVVESAGEGVDTVLASANYTLSANVENLTLTGSTALNGTGNQASNIMIGNAASNILGGQAGNDTLDGGAGDDGMFGGDGSDTYVFNRGSGRDTVLDAGSTVGNVDTLRFGVGIAAADIVITRTPTDVIFSINGTTDQVTVAYWASAETVRLERVEFVDGTFWGTAELSQRLSAIPIVGSTGNDTLIGESGDNTIDGGLGSDWMFGGEGNDVYYVDSTGDMVGENANAGVDTVYSSIAYTLGSNLENLTLTGTAAINGTGNTANNIMIGNAAVNTLNGGAGSDAMIGGAGNDIYVVDAATDVVTENLNEGTDTVQSSVSWTLGSNLENLTLTGSAAVNGIGNSLDNTLSGNSAANVLTGSAGNDTLNGGGAADTMIGGTGNDTYFVENTVDVVTELANEGTDLVQSSISHTLAANVENLTLIGSAAINGNGNTLSNYLLGNSQSNILTGDAAGETGGTAVVNTLVVYAKGSVYANGWPTMEIWIEGVQVQTFTVNTTDLAAYTVTAPLGMSANSIDVVFSNDALGNGEDRNLFLSQIVLNGRTIAASGPDAIIDYGVGTTARDWLNTAIYSYGLLSNGAVRFGVNGNDKLDGNAGADTLIGGFGNDLYVVDNLSDLVQEAANAGHDTVNASVTHTLANDIEDLQLVGTLAIDGYGNSGANTLRGNAAANRLDGGAGADVLVGGAGNDIYIVDNVGDFVSESTNGGTDTVQSSVTYTLIAEVENLLLTGTTAINGTGNASANVITGNSAVNTLSGAAGNDTLDGAEGADILIGGTGSDTYLMGRGYEFDTVQENDATAGNTDVMQFLSGIVMDQLWFSKVSNNLEVSIIGTSDKATLTNWYLGNQYHVEQFKTSDGKVLLDSQVQNLVNAMSAFAPPSAGQTTLPANYATSLNPVFAANWQ
jgi:Ca2+-binding RTX toxin-like protein